MLSSKNLLKALSDFLKQARKNAGFTQAQISNHFGYTTPQHISNIERSLILLPASTLVSLCKLYKVDLDEPRKWWKEIKWQRNVEG